MKISKEEQAKFDSAIFHWDLTDEEIVELRTYLKTERLCKEYVRLPRLLQEVALDVANEKERLK